MPRTERESDRRRREMADLLVLPRAEKKRVVLMPQREQLASMPDQSLPKGKGTEPSVQSTRS